MPKLNDLSSLTSMAIHSLKLEEKDVKTTSWKWFCKTMSVSWAFRLKSSTQPTHAFTQTCS